MLLFGGTFDPPHVGHLLMAQLALEQSAADEVWFLPAPAPPHKTAGTTPPELRYRMVEALVRGVPGMRVCAIENSLPTPSYTVDTVSACAAAYPEVDFWFLMGADSLAGLPTWKDAARLVELVPFIVAARAGYPWDETYARVKDQLPALRATPLEMPLIDVSSTFVRTRLEANLPLCGLVPEAVLQVWEGAR